MASDKRYSLIRTSQDSAPRLTASKPGAISSMAARSNFQLPTRFCSARRVLKVQLPEPLPVSYCAVAFFIFKIAKRLGLFPASRLWAIRLEVVSMQIRPIAALRGNNKLLQEVVADNPIFLTRNGYGNYAIVDLGDYNRVADGMKLLKELDLAAAEKGARDADEFFKELEE